MSRNEIIDTTAASAGITYPWWIILIEHGLRGWLLVGGGILLALRIWLACREAFMTKRESNHEHL